MLEKHAWKLGAAKRIFTGGKRSFECYKLVSSWRLAPSTYRRAVGSWHLALTDRQLAVGTYGRTLANPLANLQADLLANLLANLISGPETASKL